MAFFVINAMVLVAEMEFVLSYKNGVKHYPNLERRDNHKVSLLSNL